MASFSRSAQRAEAPAGAGAFDEKLRLTSAVSTVCLASSLVGLLALSVLAGWEFNIQVLKTMWPHLPTMKANTAVCLGLLAGAVWLSRTEASRRTHFFWICLLIGVVVLTAGVTTGEYAFHWNAGIDQLLFADVEHQNTPFAPGRFAPGTAAGSLLLAAALLLLDSRPRISHGLTLCAVLLSLICLIGYLYDLPTLYGAGQYTSLALNTIIGLLALCVGVMACRPQRGLTALVIQSSSSGSYSRLLFAASVLLPILLGYTALHLQRRGRYGPEITLALFSVMLIVLTVVIVWVTERQRRKIETKRVETARALGESEERLLLALKSAAIGTWYSDPITGTRDWDARTRAIWGFPPEMFIDGDTILACVYPEDRELVRQSVAEYVDPSGSGRFALEHRVHCWTDGSLRYVYAQGTTVFEGEGPQRRPVRSVGTMQDITASKEGERELRRLNQELEQFAYAAAHDLQEPLRNVCLATQILARRYQGKFDADADVLLKAAVDGPLRMQAMVRDLLAYSQALTSETGPTAASDANGALQIALTNLQTAVAESEAELTWDVLPAVCMSELHLVQIFQNTIGNSLKYSGGKRPRIHVGCGRRQGACTFCVKDNGMGIPPEHHERAFGVFKRLHGSKLPGTGIGLALCKRIVEFYGGRIWIESKDGEGTTLLFTVPFAAESKQAESKPAEAKSAESGRQLVTDGR